MEETQGIVGIKSFRFFPGKLILAGIPGWNSGIAMWWRMRITAWVCCGRSASPLLHKKGEKESLQRFCAPAFQALPRSCRGTLARLNSLYSHQDCNSTSQGNGKGGMIPFLFGLKEGIWVRQFQQQPRWEKPGISTRKFLSSSWFSSWGSSSSSVLWVKLLLNQLENKIYLLIQAWGTFCWDTETTFGGLREGSFQKNSFSCEAQGIPGLLPHPREPSVATRGS